MAQVVTSALHTFREREVENANPHELSHNSTEGAATSQALEDAIKARLSLVETRSATKPVICIEYLITASPEAFSRQEGHLQDDTTYFDDAKRWLRDRHGAKNVVSCTVHNDETTPHLAAYVVPLVERPVKTRKRSVIVGKGEDGKPIRAIKEFTDPGGVSLCAKEFLGGRQKLRDMQTDFAETVGKKYGLERGIEHSMAKHQSIRAFYGLIQRPVQNVTIKPSAIQPQLLKKGLLTSEFESDEMVAIRLTNAVQSAYAPAVAKAKLLETSQRRIRQIENTVKYADTRIDSLAKDLAKARLDAGQIAMTVAKGGDELLKLHEILKEKLIRSPENERSNDRGFSR